MLLKCCPAISELSKCVFVACAFVLHLSVKGHAQSFTKEVKFVQGDSLTLLFASPERLHVSDQAVVSVDFTARIYKKNTPQAHVLVLFTVIKKEPETFTGLVLSGISPETYTGTMLYIERIKNKWHTRLSFTVPLDVWMNAVAQAEPYMPFAALIGQERVISIMLSKRATQKVRYLRELVLRNKLLD